MRRSRPSARSRGLTNSRISACGTADAAIVNIWAYPVLAAARPTRRVRQERRNRNMKVCLWPGLATSAVTEAGNQPVAEHLDELNQQDEDRHRYEHHRCVETLVAIAHGQIAQASAANHARHGGVANQGDGGDDDGSEDSGQSLR